MKFRNQLSLPKQKGEEYEEMKAKIYFSPSFFLQRKKTATNIQQNSVRTELRIKLARICTINYIKRIKQKKILKKKKEKTLDPHDIDLLKTMQTKIGVRTC